MPSPGGAASFDEQDHAVVASDPAGTAARTMAAALWSEIQERYGFAAPDPFDPADFSAEGAGFWVAFDGERPIGSIGLLPLDEDAAELDVMYVVPAVRGAGVAQRLLAQLERHAVATGFARIRLRAGSPQPEAVRFYEKCGFGRIPAFGKWVGDDTAWCFEKPLPAGR